MKKTVISLLAFGLLNAADLYEIRWDSAMCTMSGGGDRRLVRKAPRDGSCLFPIPAQKNCVVVGFSNAKTFRYDGNKFILTPNYEKEPAIGDILCESVR